MSSQITFRIFKASAIFSKNLNNFSLYLWRQVAANTKRIFWNPKRLPQFMGILNIKVNATTCRRKYFFGKPPNFSPLISLQIKSCCNCDDNSITILLRQNKLASTIICDDYVITNSLHLPRKNSHHFHFGTKLYKRRHYSNDYMSSQIIVIIWQHVVKLNISNGISRLKKWKIVAMTWRRN